MQAFIGPFLYSESPTRLVIVEKGAIIVNQEGNIDQIFVDATMIPAVSKVLQCIFHLYRPLSYKKDNL